VTKVGTYSVTAVGATGGVPETAAGLSSGGFSNYFPTPDYQSGAVQGYLSTLTPDNFATLYVGANLFNASGRGFPDIAAYGENVTIITGGQLAPVAGTSCATPIFASVIALLNDRLIAAGRSPLGFLNPWLYANAHGLTDITDGSNPGCGTMGFPASVGWDPVTGLGSPNFDSLLATLGLSS
jgi:tripeptidyl-peptidase-1